MYLSSLIEPIASITTLPSHPLPPLRQIFLLRLPVEIDLSLQPQPSIQKVQGMVESESSAASTSLSDLDKNGQETGGSSDNEDSSKEVQKSGMDYKFFITGLIGKSAIHL